MKIWKKTLSCVLVLVMTLCLLPTAALAEDTNPFRIERTGQTYATLAEATVAAESGDTILVCRDAVLSEIASVQNEKSLTIKSDSAEPRTLSRDPNYTGANSFLLGVSKTGVVQLENLIFDGGAPNFKPNPNEPAYGHQNIPIANDEADVKVPQAMIVSYGKLSAKNVVFQNAYANNYRGGAVYVTGGTVEMTGCTFSHNLSGYGGGICLFGSDSYGLESASFTDCTFQNNFAYLPGGEYASGGAMYARSVGALTITGCHFLNNTASMGNGGALAAARMDVYQDENDDHESMQLTIVDSVFRGNLVGNDGFAIDASCDSTFTGCVFEENSGLSIDSSVGTVSFSMRRTSEFTTRVFDGCRFTNNGPGTPGIGDHGIYQTIVVKNTEFSNNKSYSKGNDVCLLWNSDTTFENCTFTDNECGVIRCPALPDSGSSAQALQHRPKLTVTGCRFENNPYCISVGRSTNDTRETRYKVCIQDTTFLKNLSTGYNLLSLLYADAELNNVQFKENTGAALCSVKNSATAKITNSEFSENTPRVTTVYVENGTLDLSGVRITDNESMVAALRVIRNSHATVRDGSIITRNTATLATNIGGCGGGITVMENADVTVSQDSFVYNNTSKFSGDDIGILDDTSSVTLPNVGAQQLALDDCSHRIDGWYLDGVTENDSVDAASRYIAHPAQGETAHIEPYAGAQNDDGTYTITGPIALKAAHNETPVDADPEEPAPKPPVVTQPLLLWMGHAMLNTENHYAYIQGYPDGTVRPEGDITRAEVAAIFYRLLSTDYRESVYSERNSFSDVSSEDWYNTAVSTLARAQILSGYPDGTFRPNAPISRAEFAAIVTRFAEKTGYDREAFTDVPTSHWAYESICLAKTLGWVSGYPDGSFRPDDSISRAETITLVNRVLDRRVDKERMLPGMVTFSDNSPDAWYYEAVQEATNSHSYIWLRGQVSGRMVESWTDLLPN